MRSWQLRGGSWIPAFFAVVALAHLALGATTQPASTQGVTVIATNFVSGETNDGLDGTQLGLGTNLPGGKWVWGAGWNWGSPHVNATWMGGTAQNAADLSEEKTVLALPLATSGSYTKPAQMRISARLAVAHGADGGGLGFWSAVPARDDAQTSTTNFTGLNLKLNGDLQLYEKGIATGSPIATSAITEGDFYDLSYDVNTRTGAISNVVFNGKPVAGFTSSAFTDAATAFAGAMSGSGARTSITGFSVLAITAP